MNIVNVYHLRDPYNFAEGYHHVNQYYNANAEELNAIITRQEKFFKNNDVCGYLVDILEVDPHGGEPVHTYKMKTGTEKQKIVLNPRAKREPSAKLAKLNDAINLINIAPGALVNVAAPPENIWNDWADANVEEELP